MVNKYLCRGIGSRADRGVICPSEEPIVSLGIIPGPWEDSASTLNTPGNMDRIVSFSDSCDMDFALRVVSNRPKHPK